MKKNNKKKDTFLEDVKHLARLDNDKLLKELSYYSPEHQLLLIKGLSKHGDFTIGRTLKILKQVKSNNTAINDNEILAEPLATDDKKELINRENTLLS